MTNHYSNVVVLMLENRSFDNLLGYLYESGAPSGKNYEGLQKGSFPNSGIDPHIADDYHQPFPDPGEEYQHVNTQLFDHIDPSNQGVPALEMKPPFNLPPDSSNVKPPMNGFVSDYINTLKGMQEKNFANPTRQQYSTIMQCFTPNQVPVMSTLAKEFAVFDHWFCSVPSQTWCNRAFWHSATSSGFVINPVGEDNEGIVENAIDAVKWSKEVWSKPTLFSLMTKKDISHSIYTHKDNIISLTHLIHGPKGHLAKNMDRFYEDIQSGKLPHYSFIEPKFLGDEHNDQHPSSVKNKTKDGTVLLGEKLIHDVYSALKNSDEYRDKTLLIITHDEHGGCFDHLPPPQTVAPDKASLEEGQNNFNFKRMGVRVPMVMISSYIAPNTIVNDTFDHTAFIKTMSNKWDLGYLTQRDCQSNSFESVFQEEKRSWPEISAPNLSDSHSCIDEGKTPLNNLQKSILNNASAMLHHNQGLKGTVLEKSREKVKNIKTVKEMWDHLEHLIDGSDFMIK